MTDILHLTIKGIFFDRIASGAKWLEYRDDKPYWNKRLDGKHFDEVHFRNGYSRSAPFMRVECQGIRHGDGFYEIHLGEVLEVIL